MVDSVWDRAGHAVGEAWERRAHVRRRGALPYRLSYSGQPYSDVQARAVVVVRMRMWVCVQCRVARASWAVHCVVHRVAQSSGNSLSCWSFWSLSPSPLCLSVCVYCPVQCSTLAIRPVWCPCMSPLPCEHSTHTSVPYLPISLHLALLHDFPGASSQFRTQASSQPHAHCVYFHSYIECTPHCNGALDVLPPAISDLQVTISMVLTFSWWSVYLEHLHVSTRWTSDILIGITFSFLATFHLHILHSSTYYKSLLRHGFNVFLCWFFQ